ncbi:restriction endonuclease subunit R [Candidatus Pacearchaeota archaeon CG1_02_32_132]|nr:MAG: restriction endonuclease subunit R [Candidatus Pacearchaeota archaeon CG1_02_32_132]
MALKLKFDSDLRHQNDAISSIVDLFDGQPLNQGDFEVYMAKKKGELHSHLGLGNKILLDEKDILENLKKIQEKNELPLSDNLDGLNFSIEMETGTGKTYVYLRTIFELNKKYGFKKFIVVVPSVAIREGVKKNIEITEEHFKKLYNNVPFKCQVYDSKKINQVGEFARSNNIQVLIINIDAFRKTLEDKDELSKANVIHREQDKLGGRKPIEFIQATKPIVIIDEPQSVDNTDLAKKAISLLNPSCILRYSATHREQYNLVYKLDPIKAYDLKLVKKIEVASLTEDLSANEPYIKLEKMDNSKGLRTKISILQKGSSGTNKKSLFAKQGEDLYDLSGELEIYRGYIISDIDATPKNELLTFSNGKFLTLGQEMGGIKEELIKQQIKETIKEHLKKEAKFKKLGIKVLSLFFIDRVNNYRYYDEKNKAQKGKYAQWFEESFKELLKESYFKFIIDQVYPGFSEESIERLHNGYFAQDKSGNWKDTNGQTQADDDIYGLIMRNKEQLLSMDEPLRFIFSHSALREGWDNPNVFQICTLNETKSTMKKRQEIGRGLRLPVNQKGERIYDDEINRLTVFANESYEDFVKKLQEDFEEDGMKFGIVDEIIFRKVRELIAGEKFIPSEKAKEIFIELKDKGYINKDGKIEEKFAPEKEGFKLELKESLVKYSPQITDLLKKQLLTSRVKRKRDRQPVKLKKEVIASPEFKALWQKINKKTFYSVEFSTKKLIDNCSILIRQIDKIRPLKIDFKKAEVELEKEGLDTTLLRTQEIEVMKENSLPDILSYLQRETHLTRDTIAEILIKSNRIEEFKINPQRFMDAIIEVVKKELLSLLLSGIKYERIGNEVYEIQIFQEKEIEEYLDKMIEVNNSVYDYVVYDSEVEKKFAKELDKREDVELFMKLPPKFIVNTPLGSYNPDWAVVKKDEKGAKKLYLVRETKGSLSEEDLRGREAYKIECGRRHFKAIDVDFDVVTSASEV